MEKGCNAITVVGMDISPENVHTEEVVARLVAKVIKEAREAKEAKVGCSPRKEDGRGTKVGRVARMAKEVVEEQKEKAKVSANDGGTLAKQGRDTKAFAGSVAW